MVPPVTAGLSDWQSFVSSAQLTSNYPHNLLWNLHHWNVCDIFVYLYYYPWMTSLSYYSIIFFCHWKQVIVEQTTLSSLVALVSHLSALFMFRTQISCMFTLELLHVSHLFIDLVIYSLFIYLLPYTLRFCTTDILHVFHCTLIMCMLLSATSTHLKWELMLLFTLSDLK